MALFTATGLTYKNALSLIEQLEQSGIESNITVGGVAIRLSPDQINQAKAICNEMGAGFSPGYSEIQENTMLRNSGVDYIAQATNDAISLIKEWE